MCLYSSTRSWLGNRAHAIYIGYRDEKLKDVYRDIKVKAKIGYTSTSILVTDKETAHQFKYILEKDGYLAKIKENTNKSSYSYDVHISWSTNDLTKISKYL